MEPQSTCNESQSDSQSSYSHTMRDAFNGAIAQDAKTITSTDTSKVFIVPCQWMAAFVGCIQQSNADSTAASPGKILNTPLLQTSDFGHDISSASGDNGNDGALTVDERTARRERWTRIKQAEEEDDDQAASSQSLKNGLTFGQDYSLVGDGLWTLLSNKFGFDVCLNFDVEEQSEGEKEHMNMFMAGTESGLIGGNTPANDVKDTPTRKVVKIGDDVVPLPENGTFDYDELRPRNANDDRSSGGLVSEDDSSRRAIGDVDSLDNDDDNEVPPLLLLPPSTTLPPADISLSGLDSDMVDDQNNGSSTPLSSDNGEGDDDNSAAIKSRKRKRYGAGLGNLGNTCFMNSTLQCLAHTGPLRSYFLSGEYAGDLNRDNPLGTGGELATEFANLLMEMWGTAKPSSNNNSSSLYTSKWRKTAWSTSSTSSSAVYPRNFKYTLGKHAEQFMGYNQHDSQELATYLLDALHEDTNRVSKKPYVEKPEQKEGQDDAEAAGQAWDLHLKREDSRVLESFMGQVKSRVECPNETCGRVSTTFDPFMYLSVPLPGTTETTIEVSYVSMVPGVLVKKMNVTLFKTATIKDLQDKTAELLNGPNALDGAVDANDIVIGEVFNHEIYKFYESHDEITNIKERDEIFAFQVASVESIHAEQEEEKVLDEQTISGNSDEETKPPASRLKPDLPTLTRLNKDWEMVLTSYLSSISILPKILNPTRSTHEERMQFNTKLTNFIKGCYSTSECNAAFKAAEKDTEAEESDGKMSPTSTVVSKFGATVVDDAQSLEERCHLNSLFRNVKTSEDVACLEFCRNKFYQASVNMVKQKMEQNKDGAIIQISIRKPGMLLNRSDKPNAMPIILRISPSVTVYGLRKVLAERFSHVLSCRDRAATSCEGANKEKNSSPSADEQMVEDNVGFLKGSEELRLLRQVPLTCERTSASSYSSYSKTTIYRKLGSIATAENSSLVTHRHISFAQPGDEDEKESVLEHVGKKGKVQVHFPTKECFDESKWERHEMTKHDDGDTASDSISVLNCIRKYCQIEQLEETEMWYCNKCKEHVRAWKQFHLYRAPPILIIHLKRFHYSPLTHRRDKIDLLVDFPLKNLDLRDEVMHWNQDEDEPIYDCYAVSNHFGGLGGGHYTAYALNDEGEWSNFDDSRVTKNVDESEVVSSAAYVLYYRRRDVKVEDDLWTDRPMPSYSAISSAVSSLDSRQMDIEGDAHAGDGTESDMFTGSTPPGSLADVTDAVEDEMMDFEI